MKKVLILTLVAVLLAGCGSTSVKTGLGHNISIAKSTDATAEEEGAAQVDTIMAAVNFDAAGKITSDKASQPQTKVEAGDNYGMKKKSSIGKEWYEQIADLEKWMVGKTVDEVNAMKVKKVDEDHPAVPDIADLSSKVTISVADYQAAVTEALANAR